MASIELPSLIIEVVAAVVATARPVLINRDPCDGATYVPLDAPIDLQIVDRDTAGVALAATMVWVDGELAFDGSRKPSIASPFAGPRAEVSETPDTLRVVLDPVAPFASQAKITVRVVSSTKDAAGALDETYAFVTEDRTAPKLVAGVAVAPRVFRVGFDERVAASDASAITVTPLDPPTVPVTVTEVNAKENVVLVTVRPEMTPGARYLVRALSIADLHGSVVQPPYDRVEVLGFRPPRPLGRRFDLWSMLPKHNRRADLTGDLARFVACLQEVTDLLLAEVDGFADIFDLERAGEPFLDLILRDLGNPFPFELDTLAKRRLASVLVEMYRQKGTAIGVRNAVRFFLGVDIEAITALAESALILGASELGIDWELGPSDRFARYAFSVKVGRLLTPKEQRQLRAIVEYLKPAHTHFVDLVEPLPPIVPDHWEIGVSELGDGSALH